MAPDTPWVQPPQGTKRQSGLSPTSGVLKSIPPTNPISQGRPQPIPTRPHHHPAPPEKAAGEQLPPPPRTPRTRRQQRLPARAPSPEPDQLRGPILLNQHPTVRRQLRDRRRIRNLFPIRTRTDHPLLITRKLVPVLLAPHNNRSVSTLQSHPNQFTPRESRLLRKSGVLLGERRRNERNNPNLGTTTHQKPSPSKH